MSDRTAQQGASASRVALPRFGVIAQVGSALRRIARGDRSSAEAGGQSRGNVSHAHSAPVAALGDLSDAFRAPVAVILRHAETLRSAGDLPEPQRAAAIDAIMRNGRHLLGLLDDLADLRGALPDAMADEPAGDPAGESLNARILLVEPASHEQRLIAFQLRRAGAEVEIEETGADACARALAALGAGRPFDLVLMETEMPGMDGLEATRRLRCGGCDRPIIALTTQVTAGDRARRLEAGCDDFVTKPVARASLLDACARWAQRCPGAATDAA